jgi:hypothetical protein
MKLEELGELALREYKSVKYFPFGTEAGVPFILTSDPLGYLEAFLQGKISSIRRDKGRMKNKLQKALYFTQLSKDFYNSSLTASMPSKGTLLYYSFINLTKVYLLMNGLDLETQMEHHGLSLPAKSELKLKITPINGGGVSIFHEFQKRMGSELNIGLVPELDFVDILRDLPEIHEIGYALNLFPNTKRKFLPVDIQIRTNEKRNQIFYTLSYEKKYDKQMKVDKLSKGVLLTKLIPIEIEDDNKRHYFKSKFIKSFTPSKPRSWKMCYPKLIADIDELNITPMLTRQGYRLYLNLEPTSLHRLSSVLAFGYYIGTVARYRPSLNEKILKGKYQAILNEAVTSIPNQFFYLMASHITKQTCAIPMAKIE